MDKIDVIEIRIDPKVDSFSPTPREEGTTIPLCDKFRKKTQKSPRDSDPRADCILVEPALNKTSPAILSRERQPHLATLS